MKEYLKRIVDNGKQEDMECLGNMMIEMLYHLKDCGHNVYMKYKNKIIGMAYDYKINEELAHDIVSDMKPLGELWSMDTIKSVVGEQHNLPDIYVVMNSLANDYKDVISTDDVETYVKMTTAWLNDIDAKPNKIWKYFVN